MMGGKRVRLGGGGKRERGSVGGRGMKYKDRIEMKCLGAFMCF